MIKHSYRSSPVIFLICFLISCSSGAKAPMIESDSHITIAVCSDIHYLSESLRDDKSAFTDFNNSGDGKLLEYGSEIMEGLLSSLTSENPDILIVSGDLTTNGEKSSHKDLAAYFGRIENSGTRVYVIPGNHDINNPYALGFKDTERYFTNSVTPKEFKNIYKEFGYNEAASADPASLSYLVKPAEDLWLLMLDTNKYKNNYTFNIPFTDGEIGGETLEWLNEVASEKAKANHRVEIITVTHHNLLPHSEVFTDGFTLDNYRTVGPVFQKLGISLNLSGHIHIQDIAFDYDLNIHDIATGSLSVYPQTYGLIQIIDKELTYSTKWIELEEWAIDNAPENDDLLNFKRYSKEKFKSLSEQKIIKRLSSTYSDEEIKLLASTMSSLNSRYFAGYDSIEKDEILSSEGFRLWQEAEEGFARMYIMTMLEDSSEDNSLQIPFRL